MTEDKSRGVTLIGMLPCLARGEGLALGTLCAGSCKGPCTVTRPYAGFRHPDRMAPDQTVRGGENYCFIWSGNFLAQVAKFSSIFPKPRIFQRFTWSSVRGVPFLCWYFTFLDVGRHFRNFPEILPSEKIKERAQGGIELRIYGMGIITSTSTPRLP